MLKEIYKKLGKKFAGSLLQLSQITFDEFGKPNLQSFTKEEEQDFENKILKQYIENGETLPIKIFEPKINLSSLTPTLKKFKAKQNDDVLCKDVMLPARTGYFYEKGYKVATNGHVLTKIKTSYPTKNECKIINPKGFIIDEKFINYEAVIPQNQEFVTEIDLQNFADKLNSIKHAYKNLKCLNLVHIECMTFNVSLMLTCVNSLLIAGDKTAFFKYDTPNRPIVISSNDNLALCMPNLNSKANAFKILLEQIKL